MAAAGCPASLPGWRLRVPDANHLPASGTRLAGLRGLRGAARRACWWCMTPTSIWSWVQPGRGQAGLRGRARQRAAAGPLPDGARLGGSWVADRRLCTRTMLHEAHQPSLVTSAFHLAQQARGSHEGLMIAVPPEHWPPPQQADLGSLAERLVALARRINPRQVETSKRKPKPKTLKDYVDAKTPHAPVATSRVLEQAGKRS